MGWTRTGLRVQPPGTLYDYDSFLTMEFYQNITVAVTRCVDALRDVERMRGGRGGNGEAMHCPRRSDFAAGMTMNAAVWNNSSSFQRPLDFTIM